MKKISKVTRVLAQMLEAHSTHLQASAVHRNGNLVFFKFSEADEEFPALVVRLQVSIPHKQKLPGRE